MIAPLGYLCKWSVLTHLLQFMFFSCNVAFSSMPVFLPTIIKEYVLHQHRFTISTANLHSLQHGIFLLASPSPLSTSLSCRLCRSSPHRIRIRPQPLPKPVFDSPRSHLITRLLSNRSNRLFPLTHATMASHIHPLHLRLPRHGWVLFCNHPHHHMVNG